MEGKIDHSKSLIKFLHPGKVQTPTVFSTPTLKGQIYTTLKLGFPKGLLGNIESRAKREEQLSQKTKTSFFEASLFLAIFVLLSYQNG